MNRKELVAALADRTDRSTAEADAHLTALADVLVDVVKRGDRLQLPGVLTVERVERAARSGRNPRTGETMEIPAGYGVKLTAGSRLKAAVSER